MAAVYFLGLLCVLGYAQSTPFNRGHSPAIIEDLRQASGSRVVGGWPAVDGQIPHQVSIRMVNRQGSVSSCGGSIIHPKWIITAAHCLANRDTFVVRLGLTNLTTPEYIVESSRKYIHPRYNEVTAGVQVDDIALLGLDRPITLGPHIQPCRLQNSETKNSNYASTVATVSGYGMTDDSWNGGTSSEILLWTFLRGISNAECRSFYGNIIQDQIVCAEYYNNTAQSSCQGDSGGPLTVVDVDGKPTMIGVVSFGSTAGCNSVFPSAYVRPGHYHDWLYEVTGINFDWSSDDLVSPTTPEPQDTSEETEESEESKEDSKDESEESKEDSKEEENSESSSSEEDSVNAPIVVNP